MALAAALPASVWAEEAAADANAATAEATQNTNSGTGFPMWAVLLIYVAIFVLIGYFLIYRPQKKRKKEEQEMRDSLTLGSEVTTIGGICGKVVNIKDDNVTIETSLDRTLFEVKNWAIREIKKVETADQ
jgi:preprotein translocase subunit YajC